MSGVRISPGAPNMAGVAQSVERQIVALEVASSKLVARPIYFFGLCPYIGVSPSGKARDFDSRIRRFKSCHPSQIKKVVRVSGCD